MFPHSYIQHSSQPRRGFATSSPLPFYSHPAAQQFKFYPSSPSPSPLPPTTSSYQDEYGYSSIEDEERAALAHLRSIQRRREEAQAQAQAVARAEREATAAAARREAEIQARVEREAAIRSELARIQRQNQIAQVIRQQQIAEDQRRKQAYAQAIQAKRAELLQAQLAAQAQRQAALAAHHQRRQAQIAEAQAQAQAQIEARRRSACQARCQRRSAPTPKSSTPSTQESNEWQDLNNLFGPLFGFHLVPDAEHGQDYNSTDATTSQTRTEAPAVSESEPAPAAATASTPAPATSAPIEEIKDSSKLPEDLNEILSQFLGLRVDPLSSSDSSSSVDRARGNDVPEGLNELLGQFGLVFEPEEKKEETKEEKKEGITQPKAVATEQKSAQPAQPASAESSSSAAPQHAAQPEKEVPPFTSLLGQFTDVNPFLRDLLGNFEHALTDEFRKQSQSQSQDCSGQCERKCARPCGKECSRKDKGKGRAEGERREVPQPAVTSTPVTAPTPVATAAPVSTESTTESTESSASIKALDSIEKQLQSLRSSFTFPEKLSFAQSTSPEHESAPALLFNKVNSSYHSQAHELLQLMLKADGISSNGNKDIRKRRKQIVKSVENEIETLEKKRDNLWEQTKLKRQNGEESEVESDESSWSGSETNSSIGDHEHIQQEKDQQQEVEHVEEASSAPREESPEEQKSYADVAKVHPEEPTSEANQTAEATPSENQEVPKEAEPQGYTITVSFPSQPEQLEEVAENKEEAIEEDKKSDRSARVEDEDESKEEGYELL